MEIARRLAIVLAICLIPGVAMAADATVTLAIPGMTCPLCPLTVKTAPKRVAGVKDVAVDFDKKLASVRFDDAMTSIEKLTDATRDAGYPSQPKD
jgi:mercuric ion binding protein